MYGRTKKVFHKGCLAPKNGSGKIQAAFSPLYRFCAATDGLHIWFSRLCGTISNRILKADFFLSKLVDRDLMGHGLRVLAYVCK